MSRMAKKKYGSNNSSSVNSEGYFRAQLSEDIYTSFTFTTMAGSLPYRSSAVALFIVIVMNFMLGVVIQVKKEVLRVVETDSTIGECTFEWMLTIDVRFEFFSSFITRPTKTAFIGFLVRKLEKKTW